MSIQISEKEHRRLKEAEKTHEFVGFALGSAILCALSWYWSPRIAHNVNSAEVGKICATKVECINAFLKERKRLGL